MAALSGHTCHLLRAAGFFRMDASCAPPDDTPTGVHAVARALGSTLSYQSHEDALGAIREALGAVDGPLGGDQLMARDEVADCENRTSRAGCELAAFFSGFTSLCNGTHPIFTLSEDTDGRPVAVDATLRSVAAQQWMEALWSQAADNSSASQHLHVTAAERSLERLLGPQVEAAWAHSVVAPIRGSQQGECSLESVAPGLHRVQLAGLAHAAFVSGIHCEADAPRRDSVVAPPPAHARRTSRTPNVGEGTADRPVPALICCWGDDGVVPGLLRCASEKLTEAVMTISVGLACRVPYTLSYVIAGEHVTVTLMAPLAPPPAAASAAVSASTGGEGGAALALLASCLSSCARTAESSLRQSLQLPVLQLYPGLDGCYYILPGPRVAKGAVGDFFHALQSVAWEPAADADPAAAAHECTSITCRVMECFDASERRANPVSDLLASHFVSRLLLAFALPREVLPRWHAYVLRLIADGGAAGDVAKGLPDLRVVTLRRLEAVLASEMLIDGIAFAQKHLSRFLFIKMNTTLVDSPNAGETHAGDMETVASATLECSAGGGRGRSSGEFSDDRACDVQLAVARRASCAIHALNCLLHTCIYGDAFHRTTLPVLLHAVFPSFSGEANFLASCSGGTAAGAASSLFADTQRNNVQLLPFGDVIMRLQRCCGVSLGFPTPAPHMQQSRSPTFGGTAPHELLRTAHQPTVKQPRGPSLLRAATVARGSEFFRRRSSGGGDASSSAASDATDEHSPTQFYSVMIMCDAPLRPVSPMLFAAWLLSFFSIAQPVAETMASTAARLLLERHRGAVEVVTAAPAGSLRTAELLEMAVTMLRVCRIAPSLASVGQHVGEDALLSVVGHLAFTQHLAVPSSASFRCGSLQTRHVPLAARAVGLAASLLSIASAVLSLLQRRGSFDKSSAASQRLVSKGLQVLVMLHEARTVRSSGPHDLRLLAHEALAASHLTAALRELEQTHDTPIVTPTVSPASASLAAPGAISSTRTRRRSGSTSRDGVSHQPVTTPSAGNPSHYAHAAQFFAKLAELEGPAGTFDRQRSDAFLETFISSPDGAHLDEAIDLCAGIPQRAIDYARLLLRKAALVEAASANAGDLTTRREQRRHARRVQNRAFLVLLPLCDEVEAIAQLRRTSETLAEAAILAGRGGSFEPEHGQLSHAARTLARRVSHSSEFERELQRWGLLIPFLMNLSRLLHDLRQFHEAYTLAAHAKGIAEVAHQPLDGIRSAAEEHFQQMAAAWRDFCVGKVQRHLGRLMRRWLAVFRKKQAARCGLVSEALCGICALENTWEGDLRNTLILESRARVEAQHAEAAAVLQGRHSMELRELLGRLVVLATEDDRRRFVTGQAEVLRATREAMRMRGVALEMLEREQLYTRMQLESIEFSAMAALAFYQQLVLGLCRHSEDARQVLVSTALVMKRMAADHFRAQHSTSLRHVRMHTTALRAEQDARGAIEAEEEWRFALYFVHVHGLIEREEAHRCAVEDEEGSVFYFLSRSIAVQIDSQGLEEALELIDLGEYSGRAEIVRADAAFWAQLRMSRKILAAEEQARIGLYADEGGSFFEDVLVCELLAREAVARAAVLAATMATDAPLRALAREPRRRHALFCSSRLALLADTQTALDAMERCAREDISMRRYERELLQLQVLENEDRKRCVITRLWLTKAVQLQVEVLGIRTAAASLLRLHHAQHATLAAAFLVNYDELVSRCWLVAELWIAPQCVLRTEMALKKPHALLLSRYATLARALHGEARLIGAELNSRSATEAAALELLALLAREHVRRGHCLAIEEQVRDAFQHLALTVGERMRRAERDYALRARALRFWHTFSTRAKSELKWTALIADEGARRLLRICEEESCRRQLDAALAAISAPLLSPAPTCDTEAERSARERSQVVAARRASLLLEEQRARSLVLEMAETQHDMWLRWLDIAHEEEETHRALRTDDADNLRRERYACRPDLTLSWLAVCAQVRKFIRTVATDEDNEQYQYLCLHPPSTPVDLRVMTAGAVVPVSHYMATVSSLRSVCDGSFAGVFPAARVVHWNRARFERIALRCSGFGSNAASAAMFTVMDDAELAQLVADVPLRAAPSLQLAAPALRAAAHVANNQVLFEAAELRALFVSAMLSGSAPRLMALVDRDTAAGRLYALQKHEERSRLSSEALLALQLLEIRRRAFVHHREITTGAVALRLRHVRCCLETHAMEQQQRERLAVEAGEGVPRAALATEHRRRVFELKREEAARRPPQNCHVLLALHRVAADMAYRALQLEPSWMLGPDIFAEAGQNLESGDGGGGGVGGGGGASAGGYSGGGVGADAATTTGSTDAARRTSAASRALMSPPAVPRHSGARDAVLPAVGIGVRDASSATRATQRRESDSWGAGSASFSLSSAPLVPLVASAGSSARVDRALAACVEAYPALAQLIRFATRDPTVFRLGVSRANIFSVALHDAAMIFEEGSREWHATATELLSVVHRVQLRGWKALQEEGCAVVHAHTIVLRAHRAAVQRTYSDGVWALRRVAVEREEEGTRQVIFRAQPDHFDRLADQFHEDATIIVMIAEIRESAVGYFGPRRGRRRLGRTGAEKLRQCLRGDDGACAAATDVPCTPATMMLAPDLGPALRAHTAGAHAQRPATTFPPPSPGIEIRERPPPVRPLSADTTFARAHDACGGDRQSIEKFFARRHPLRATSAELRCRPEEAAFIAQRAAHLEQLYSSDPPLPLGIFRPAVVPFSAATTRTAPTGAKRASSAAPRRSNGPRPPSRRTTGGHNSATAAIVGRLRPATASHLRL